MDVRTEKKMTDCDLLNEEFMDEKGYTCHPDKTMVVAYAMIIAATVVNLYLVYYAWMEGII